MNTPICDFVEAYAQSGAVRLHMPGHKGRTYSPALDGGVQALDLTEIAGADDLYHPQGIIRESEENAAALFGAGATLYSTGGSSQCVRAMLYLALLAFYERRPGARPVVVAGRNAHKSFLTAAALLDFDIHWLCPQAEAYSLCRCPVTPGQVERALLDEPDAAALYVTSPDYLGHCVDLAPLGRLAREKGVPLLVDNAHGAYLRFLPQPRHPLDQGAVLCCDSAHKTLPVLTGGAYLHIARGAPERFFKRAREAMGLFGSTSPSYLILRSLDQANRALAGDYPQRLAEIIERAAALKHRLGQRGWRFTGDEPLKLTLDAKDFGITGTALGEALNRQGVVHEYADRDFLVLMLSAGTSEEDLARLEQALLGIEPTAALPGALPAFTLPERVLPVRRTLFLPSRQVSVEEAAGKVAATLTAACPPAVLPAVPGERIGKDTVAVYKYYGIETVEVLAR